MARQAVQGDTLDGFFLVPINDMADPKRYLVTDQPPEHLRERQSEPVFFMAPVVTGLIAVCAGLFLLQSNVIDSLLAFIPARYGASGIPIDLASIFSPLGYSLLHASFFHLAINMVWLAAFGSPLAARIGTWRFLLFWSATALGAAGLHFLVYPDSIVPLVGASGAISGMMGAAARFSFRTSQGRGVRSFVGLPLSIGASLTNRTVLTFVGIWMLVNLLTGLFSSSGDTRGSSIAWEAHIGGFLIGFLCLSAFDRRTGALD